MDISKLELPRRQTVEPELKTRIADRTLSHADLCHLSRVFNAAVELRTERDQRINEWLKEQIVAAQRGRL